MSLVNRQRTCACCGKPIGKGDSYCIEPLVDANIRYVVIHLGESTFPRRMGKKEEAPVTLTTKEQDTHTGEC